MRRRSVGTHGGQSRRILNPREIALVAANVTGGPHFPFDLLPTKSFQTTFRPRCAPVVRAAESPGKGIDEWQKRNRERPWS